jgi:cytochrome b subunit of formate dehydrogenase
LSSSSSLRRGAKARPPIAPHAVAVAARCLSVLLVALALAHPARAAQIGDDQCLKCHGDLAIAEKRPESLAGMVRIPKDESPVFRSAERVKDLYVSGDSLRSSAHAGLRCADCHSGIENLPHNQRLATTRCQDCHALVEEAIASGPHAEDESDGRLKPSCADCHFDPHAVGAVRGQRSYAQSLKIVETCGRCHDGDEGGPVESYRGNVHGEGLLVKGLAVSATCVDCHGHHTMLPPSEPDSPLHPLKAPDTCGKCHQGVEDIYLASVHGRRLLAGEEDGATCTTCHSSHGIGPIEEPFLQSIVEECSHCHLDLGRSYLTSYHGKASRLGYGETAVCSSCHGAHDILPESDINSRVHPDNLIKTCSACHEDANENFVKYITHLDITDRKANPPVFYTWLFMTTLLVSVLAVFTLHTLLWFQRSCVRRLKEGPGPAHKHKNGPQRMVRRFHPVHQITHVLVMISFMGLVITGFPLKYSYAVWAKDLAALFGGAHVLGIIHRFLAVVTFSYAGIHLAFLAHFFAFRCPKPRWKYIIGPDSMVFSWRDIKDALAMLRYFLFLGPRPRFERWTYFEKFDYWGEIWGVIIIGGTGFMLWFPQLISRWLPGWVLNCAMVVHSIEALLAASVIFLIHFFNTHLRPRKFPMDMVMMTGRMPEEEMIDERGAEYDRLVQTGQLESRIVPPVALKWRIVGAAGGFIAFVCGIVLIVLALITELQNVLGR